MCVNAFTRMMNDDYEKRAWNTGLITSMLWTAGLALLTGFALYFPYKADARTAYSSVSMISHGGALSFVRNLHHWLSALLVVLGEITIIVGIFRGAYRKPGHWLWLSVIALFLVGLASQITGHLLPFDVQAVRTAVVETGIAGSAPVVGPAQANLIRGGPSVGPQTLHLWFVLHVAAFTVALIALLVLIPLLAKKLGLTLNKVAWIVCPLAIAIVASAIFKAPLGNPASSGDYGSFAARPEWYILPLHSLLTISQSVSTNYAFVGTMVIPGLALLLLIALPWLDRSGHAAWSKGLGTFGALCLIVLLGIGGKDLAPPVGNQVLASTDSGSGGGQKIDPKLVAQGRDLFSTQGCDDCHTIAGKGGKIGPDLTAEATRHSAVDWQIKHLQNPAAVTPGSTMPKFGNLKPADLSALAQYLVSLNGKAK